MADHAPDPILTGHPLEWRECPRNFPIQSHISGEPSPRFGLERITAGSPESGYVVGTFALVVSTFTLSSALALKSPAKVSKSSEG